VTVRLSADRYTTFVVRIRSRDGVFVQGEISRVGSGESTVFRDPAQIVAFIVAQLGSRGGAAPEHGDAP